MPTSVEFTGNVKKKLYNTLVLFLPAAFLFRTLSFLFQDLLNYALMCLGTSSDVVQDHDVIKQVLISIELIRLVTPQEKTLFLLNNDKISEILPYIEAHSCIVLRNSQIITRKQCCLLPNRLAICDGR